MPLYKYRAVDDGGAPLEGKMEESSAYRVTTILRERGLQVNSVEEVEPSKALPRKTASLSWSDIDLLNEQLLAIVRSNLPLAPALKALAQDVQDKEFRSVLDDVRARLESGDTLETALAMHPKSFPPLYLAAIRAGEQTGNLLGVLTLLSAYSKRMVEFQYRAKELLAYPILLLAASTCVVAFLMGRIIPLFAEIFGDFGAKLPWLTQFWIELSLSTRERIGMWLFVALVLLLAWKLLARMARSGKRIARFVENVGRFTPYYRTIRRLAITARFSRTLGMLLASRVSVTDSIELAAGASGSVRLYEAMRKVQESIAAGWSVNESFRKSGLFDSFFCWIVGVAEDRGDLSDALQSLAATYEERLGSASSMALKLVGPAIVFCVGAVVASIVIALYLPIFSLGDVVSGN
ncbi:MAG: type II secretion system F family protein [Candidatus Hydrogenedentes bacterium]|nr:type II secretion system F family protein [Candidatus Hydrogenedentota bacterium]